MIPFTRGVLLEYSAVSVGNVPNAVLFQFNPEALSRSFELPSRPKDGKSEPPVIGIPRPTEKISLTAYFNAYGDKLPTVAPRLAALERMLLPRKTGLLSSLLDDLTLSNSAVGEQVDKAAACLGEVLGSGSSGASTTVPTVTTTPLLFIWGAARIIPVVLDSLKIVEQQFDPVLQPVRAEVTLGLTVLTAADGLDVVSRGALAASRLSQETLVAANLASLGFRLSEWILGR